MQADGLHVVALGHANFVPAVPQLCALAQLAHRGVGSHLLQRVQRVASGGGGAVDGEQRDSAVGAVEGDGRENLSGHPRERHSLPT